MTAAGSVGGATAVAPRPPEHRGAGPDREAQDAEARLVSALEPIVDMVVTTTDDGYEARAVDGRVRFRRERAPGERGWRFVEVEVEGRNPLGDTATDRWVGLADELGNRWPDRPTQSDPTAIG